MTLRRNIIVAVERIEKMWRKDVRIDSCLEGIDLL